MERALGGIPLPFARALDEVAIVIADEPTREELRENGLDPDEMLYGLYEGTPRTEWGADFVPVPEQDHALPPRRSRRTSRIPATSPTRSGRR